MLRLDGRLMLRLTWLAIWIGDSLRLCCGSNFLRRKKLGRRMIQTTAGAHGRNVPGWYGSTAYSGHSSHARAAPGDRWVPVSVNTLTRLLNDLEPARHPVRGRIWARIQHHKHPEPALELSS